MSPFGQGEFTTTLSHLENIYCHAFYFVIDYICQCVDNIHMNEMNKQIKQINERNKAMYVIKSADYCKMSIVDIHNEYQLPIDPKIEISTTWSGYDAENIINDALSILYPDVDTKNRDIDGKKETNGDTNFKPSKKNKDRQEKNSRDSTHNLRRLGLSSSQGNKHNIRKR